MIPKNINVSPIDNWIDKINIIIAGNLHKYTNYTNNTNITIKYSRRYRRNLNLLVPSIPSIRSTLLSQEYFKKEISYNVNNS